MTRLALALVTISITLCAPVALAALFRRRASVGWSVFLAGVTSFVLSQVVHLPMLWALGKVGLVPTAASIEMTPLRALVLGLAAGACEETARWAMLRRLPGELSGSAASSAVMFGLGHGGIEAMLLGGVLMAAQVTSMTALQHADLAALAKDAVELESLRQQVGQFRDASPWMMLVPLIERVMALGAQMTMSLMVVLSLTTGKKRWFAASVALHATIDGASVYASQRLMNALETELGVFALTTPGTVWLLWRLRRMDLNPRPSPTRFSEEWARFAVMVRKELRQPWRNRSALMVLGVFLGVACLAPAIPLSLKLIPEEARAKLASSGLGELIPASSTQFALDQYVKLFTQLGFLVVGVLAALSVAGERQRGVLAMLFSKPVPRWALVVSKSVAHAALCVPAVLLGAGACAAITWALYGPPDLAGFMACNALLLLWLVTWVAVAIAASCSARSEGGAIGWMALAAAVMLLAGAVPRVGAVMPSGLTGWAHEVASGKEVHANGAAMAMSVVIILLAMVKAIERIEAAEL